MPPCPCAPVRAITRYTSAALAPLMNALEPLHTEEARAGSRAAGQESGGLTSLGWWWPPAPPGPTPPHASGGPPPLAAAARQHASSARQQHPPEEVVVCPVLDSSGAQRGGVAAAARLGEAVGGELLHAGQPRQVARLELLAAKPGQVGGAAAGMAPAPQGGWGRRAASCCCCCCGGAAAAGLLARHAGSPARAGRPAPVDDAGDHVVDGQVGGEGHLGAAAGEAGHVDCC
jgi:hypothetical protein